jgi:hypothetical protein
MLRCEELRGRHGPGKGTQEAVGLQLVLSEGSVELQLLR